jgi:CopG family transcriptional regulator, nickel-responsive regulator
MKGVVRFGVAMEGTLLDQFDRHIHQRGYANRSEALRDLVRGQLAQAAWERGDRTVATITIVYDHHVRELTERLNAIQHDYGDNVVSSLHVHLNHHQCLEVIVARGQANVLKKMADEITRTKGVLVGNITAAPAGEGDE